MIPYYSPESMTKKKSFSYQDKFGTWHHVGGEHQEATPQKIVKRMVTPTNPILDKVDRYLRSSRTPTDERNRELLKSTLPHMRDPVFKAELKAFIDSKSEATPEEGIKLIKQARACIEAEQVQILRPKTI